MGFYVFSLPLWVLFQIFPTKKKKLRRLTNPLPMYFHLQMNSIGNESAVFIYPNIVKCILTNALLILNNAMFTFCICQLEYGPSEKSTFFFTTYLTFFCFRTKIIHHRKIPVNKKFSKIRETYLRRTKDVHCIFNFLLEICRLEQTFQYDVADEVVP